jgi:hypothetical protein
MWKFCQSCTWICLQCSINWIQFFLSTCFLHNLLLYEMEPVAWNLYIYAGLWSQYTKLPTPTPTTQFLKLWLKLWLRLLQSSVCVNDGKPVRHFITTT